MKKTKKIYFEEEKNFEFLMAFRKYRELRNNYEKLIENFQKATGIATDIDRKNKMLEAENERLVKEIRKLKTVIKKQIEPNKISKEKIEELKSEMPEIPKEKKCKPKKSSSKDV